jgi:hypothetical protein
MSSDRKSGPIIVNRENSGSRPLLENDGFRIGNAAASTSYTEVICSVDAPQTVLAPSLSVQTGLAARCRSGDMAGAECFRSSSLICLSASLLHVILRVDWGKRGWRPFTMTAFPRAPQPYNPRRLPRNRRTVSDGDFHTYICRRRL